MLFVAIFLLYEIVLLPLVYIIVMSNIGKKSDSVCKSILYFTFWIFIGLFICFGIAIYDCITLLKLYSKLKGCLDGKVNELQEEEVTINKKIAIYNEVRRAMISIYLKLKKHFKEEDGNSSDDSSEKETDHIV